MESRESKVDRDRNEIKAAASVAVNEAGLQLEHQRIVLVCGCGARTTIQIVNDGHESLCTASKE